MPPLLSWLPCLASGGGSKSHPSIKLGPESGYLELSTVLTQFFCSNWRDPTGLLLLTLTLGSQSTPCYGGLLGSRATLLAPDSVESFKNGFRPLLWFSVQEEGFTQKACGLQIPGPLHHLAAHLLIDGPSVVCLGCLVYFCGGSSSHHWHAAVVPHQLYHAMLSASFSLTLSDLHFSNTDRAVCIFCCSLPLVPDLWSYSHSSDWDGHFPSPWKQTPSLLCLFLLRFISTLPSFPLSRLLTDVLCS